MKKLVFISVAGFLLAGTAYADFDLAAWKYKKDVTALPSSQSGGFIKVNLDRQISVDAKRDLSDIRVIANDKDETAYQLVTENESVRTEYRTTFLRDLSSKDGETMFILDLQESGVVHDHLTIQTGSKNFKRTVSVYAADQTLTLSDSKWRLLTDKGYVYNFYDQASGFNAGSGEVSYPQNTSHYLKVVIKKGEGSDVSVSSAHVLRLLTKDAVESQLQLTANITHNLVHKTTEINLDLGGSGIPTHRLILSTSDSKNFSRRAVVEESNDKVSWSAVGDGYVFSLATPLFTGTELSISYRESQARYIRVIILDQDDMPVAWEGTVRVDSVVRAVVFQTTAGNTYALYYGNDLSRVPQYDLARYFQYVESTDLARATLGGEVPNPGYLPPAAPKPPLQGPPNLLNGVLILMVALITFLLISYLKKLKLAERGIPGEKKD